MTKRWLSLVLVFTLFSTLFTGVAFAADKTVTVEPASDFVVSAGDTVYQQNIGTIKVDGNSIGTEDWTALQGKILVTATGMSVSNAVATLDQQGGILVSFAVPSTGAADAQFAVSLNGATGYSMGAANKGAKVTLATVPVGQVVVQQYNNSTQKFFDVSALENQHGNSSG